MAAQEEPGGPPRREALTSRYPATATTRPAKARPGVGWGMRALRRAPASAQACPGERSGDARGGHDEREGEVERASCAEVSGHGEQ